MVKSAKEKKTSSPKKDKKAALKKAREVEKSAILNEKKKLTEEIKSLKKEKKGTKEKTTKREIKSKIKKLKYQKSRIGKKDTYFSDVMAEMHMVRWPNRKEIVKYSIACLIFVAFFALFFYGMDALFALVKDLID